MAGTTFNIPALIQQYFGLQGANQPGEQYSGITAAARPVDVARSIAGVPIYEQFTFTEEANGQLIIDYTFPGWPLMALDFPINIVKTPVTGLPGTVKDFIGEGDVEIGIRGLLINHDSYDIPLDQMQALKQLLKRTLKVSGRVLNALDIHYLVIERLSFLEVEGNLQVQPFFIEALSDYPYELVIQDAAQAKKLTAQQKARALLLGNG